MYKNSFVIKSAEEARRFLNSVNAIVNRINIDNQVKALLLEQLKTTIHHTEKQLGSDAIGSYKSDRVFEGDGYKITIRIRRSSGSPIDKIKKMIGLS